MLSDAWRAPGSPPLQVAAIVAATMFFIPAAFSLNKRTGAAGAPPRWFVAHVLASLIGMVLAAAHSGARLDGPPAIMLAAIVVLAASGVAARVYLSRNMAATFGTKRKAFGAPDENQRTRLRGLIERKRQVLGQLDPQADEATFSVTLSHWLRRPRLALAYHRLQRTESRLIGARQSVGMGQAWWRPLHVLVGYGLMAGLIVHIVTVTFFAGYVAEGRTIYWWHVTAW